MAAVGVRSHRLAWAAPIMPNRTSAPTATPTITPVAGTGTTTYAYDFLSRLRTVTYPDASWSSHVYDPMGNRTELDTSAGSTTYGYDGSDRLLSASGQQVLTFGWDTRCNQTAKGSQSFGYDSADRLTTANTGTNTATYIYSGEGVRVGKTVNGTATTYLQDVVGGLPRVLVETTGGQETLYVYGLGLAFQVNPDGSHRYYHADSLGSTRVVTDDSGNPVSAYSYDAYGAVRQSAGEGKAFTYTGEELDTETSLVFLRARTYDPATGRFLQRDSIVPDLTSSQGINRYSYASGDPTRYSDPSGHDLIMAIAMALWENLNRDTATPAGGDLYDANGQPCGYTGCVPPAPSESEIYEQAATDAMTMDLTGRATGAVWDALKPSVAAGLQKLGDAAKGVLGRGAVAAADTATSGLSEGAANATCRIAVANFPRIATPYGSARCNPTH